MSESLINKVTESGILTLNLEDFYPRNDISVFDLKEYLFMELILKEKDFRAALQNTDWERYRNKYVGVTCTADAIVPMWAYMLATSYIQPVAKDVVYGNEQDIAERVLLKNLLKIDAETYRDKRVVIKGCGEIKIPESAYLEITNKLRPVVKSIMYGEPCSTVPIYKARN